MPAPKPDPAHPPIVALREHLLQRFHGTTSSVFANAPGFGGSRMEPTYELIPFEIPYLSPTELELTDPPQTPERLKAVFADSLAAFRTPKLTEPSRDRTVEFATMQLRTLDLIGLLDKQNPRAYSGGQAFEVAIQRGGDHRTPFRRSTVVLTGGSLNLGSQYGPRDNSRYLEGYPVRQVQEPQAHPATRPLDQFEQAGVAELLKGAETHVRGRGEYVRMLGALRASEWCLKCHSEANKGDLLGAFSYVFFDPNNRLFEKQDRANRKKR